MIEYVFIDLDDTILDFHKTERIALKNTLIHFGIAPTEETMALYKQINLDHWSLFEQGKIDRKQVNEGRFEVLFRKLDREVDGQACAAFYLAQLGLTCDYLPGAREAISALSQKYRIFIASNGNASVQIPRIQNAGLLSYCEQAFISESLGANKPSKAYFDLCFAHIEGFAPDRAIMVGDRLPSDIQGGINAGIRTCWFNPNNEPNNTGIIPDFEIRSLSQLENLLNRL